MLGILLIIWASMSLIMAVLWYVQKIRNDASVVDAAWAAGVGASAVLFAGLGEGGWAPRVALAGLAGTWSLRLTYYLLSNRVIGKLEDGRYKKLRDEWHPNVQRNFFLFFQAQAVFVVLFAIPFGAVAFNPNFKPDGFLLSGILVGMGAILGEATADAQLAAFRANPTNKGKTCRAGMWGYSRHPNYFFEWIHWFAYVLMSVNSPYFWLSLSGPAVMLFFLYRLTGIPYTEKQALASRGEDYREYQRTVSAFVPWFKKK